MQSVRFVMARNSNCIYPRTTPTENLMDLSRPTIYKFNNSIVFEYLEVLHIPFELDYVEVLLALLDALTTIYEQLLHEDCYSNAVAYDTIVRLDTRLKHHVINAIAKELTEAAAERVRGEMNSLRNFFNYNNIGKAIFGGKKTHH